MNFFYLRVSILLRKMLKQLNMKTKNSFRKITALAFAGMLFCQVGVAQLNQVDFIKGGLENGELMLKEYVAPWANSLGASLNGGWYNTAKPHKLGGFDLTITVNTTVVPDAAKYFDVGALDFTGGLQLTDPADNMASTIAGPKGEGPELRYVEEFGGTEYSLATFNTPGGTGVGVLPLPMVQFGLGLVKGTDVTVRYLPRLNIFDAGSVGMWGVGLKHSIVQWFPGSALIPFELSLFGAYTELTSLADVNFQPSSYGVPVNLESYTDADFDNQMIGLDMSAWTVNLIASKSLAILTVYGGGGYSSTRANLYMDGNYPLTQLNTDDPGNPYVEVADASIVEDPINIEVKNFSGLRLNAGLRLKLALLTLHFDYTWADYSVYTGGIGISFR